MPEPQTLAKNDCARKLASPWKRIWRKSDSNSEMITIAKEDPRSPEVSRLLSAFVEEVKKRYDAPPADVGIFDPVLVSVPRSVFLVRGSCWLRSTVRWTNPASGSQTNVHRQRRTRPRMLPWFTDAGTPRSESTTTRSGRTGVKQPKCCSVRKSGFLSDPQFSTVTDDSSAVCLGRKSEKGIRSYRIRVANSRLPTPVLPTPHAPLSTTSNPAKRSALMASANCRSRTRM
jgi:hypothetical protein